MPEDGVFFTVQGNLAKTLSHISVIGIGHLSGAIDYAAHYGNDNILEVGGTLLYLIKGVFQVIERPSASGA